MANEIKRADIKVGDGVTLMMWSDAHAYTVIGRTAKTLKIQRDKATLKPDFKPEFDAFYCTNNKAQEYDYERDEEGAVVTVRWSEKKQGFYDICGSRITDGRHEFYDYNF